MIARNARLMTRGKITLIVKKREEIYEKEIFKKYFPEKKYLSYFKQEF